MQDEIKTAQENAETAEIESNADLNQQEQVNEATFEDTKADETAAVTEKQTREQNSENARRRREAERQAELKSAREQAIIETLNGRNPFTGDEMKDSADVEEYLLMKEIEKSGGDPLVDFAKHQKMKRRETEKQATEESSKKEWFNKDRDDFIKTHPDVKLDDLLADTAFQRYAEGKVGNIPLSQIYDGYNEIIGEYEKRAQAKAKQMLANSKASVGSLSTTNPPDGVFYTRDQVRAMTQEQVHEKWEDIQKSMKRWKN